MWLVYISPTAPWALHEKSFTYIIFIVPLCRPVFFFVFFYLPPGDPEHHMHFFFLCWAIVAHIFAALNPCPTASIVFYYSVFLPFWDWSKWSSVTCNLAFLWGKNLIVALACFLLFPSGQDSRYAFQLVGLRLVRLVYQWQKANAWQCLLGGIVIYSSCVFSNFSRTAPWYH